MKRLTKYSQLILLQLISLLLPTQTTQSPITPEYISNFGNFTDQLIHVMETNEPTEYKPGVHMYTPFSIGYLLANIYENLWPLPVKELPEAIFTLKRYVATDYAALLRLFKKRQFRVSSTIYSTYPNTTKPETFPQLLTQVINLDIQKNRTEFKQSLTQTLSHGTKSHLTTTLLPEKDPAWREIFDNTTHGVYTNTLHYKTNWDKPWEPLGVKKYFDGSTIEYLGLTGTHMYSEGPVATAVRVSLQGGSKELVFFKPKDYKSVTDMRRVVRGMLNEATVWSSRVVSLQIPNLNVTNLAQPSDKFGFVGVTDTFCRGKSVTDPEQYYYNQHPIAHANHFEFNPEYIEIASASGSLISYENNKDYVPKPQGISNSSVIVQQQPPVVMLEMEKEKESDYFDILEAVEEEDERFQDYIVDARSSLLPISKRVYKQSSSGAAGEYFRRIVVEANGTDEHDDGVLLECVTDNEVVDDDMKIEVTTSLPLLNDEVISTVEEPVEFILDTPFAWVLRDSQIGDVFYGSVSSLCQYNRAVSHIPSVPTWVLDLFKAFYWRCV